MPVPCQASPDPSKPGLTMLRIALNEIVSANEIRALPSRAQPCLAMPHHTKPRLTMPRSALNKIMSANEIPATPYHAPPIQA